LSSLTRWLQQITKRWRTPIGSRKRAAWSGQRHFIMMHFEKTDIDRFDPTHISYDPTFFGEFDGFVFGHVGYKNNIVLSLIASGKRFFSYHLMLCYPRTDEVGGGSAWLDWWHSVVQLGQNARMVVGGLIGYMRGFYSGPPTCEHREFVDWAKVTNTIRQSIVNQLWFLRPWGGMFFDLSWQRPEEFYFFFCDASTPPDAYGCEPCATGLPVSSYTTNDAYQASVRDFWQKAQQEAEQRGTYVLLNGNFRDSNGQPMPMPIYLENSGQHPTGTPFSTFAAIWKEDSRNVLSMVVPNAQYFPQMVEEFRANGGWVALTGPAAQDSVMRAHYAQLQAVRAAG